MFSLLYAYSRGLWCHSLSRSQCCHESIIRMVTRFTAFKNRCIFRLRKVVGGELPLETETCRFVLTSLLDLFMTFMLLYFSNRGMMRNVVVESNPIAQYFISGWGTLGLVWFKDSNGDNYCVDCTNHCDKKTVTCSMRTQWFNTFCRKRCRVQRIFIVSESDLNSAR